VTSVLRPLAIEGAWAVAPQLHADERGSFAEHYRAEWIPEAAPVVQANHAARRAGSLVGLHYHRFQADHWYVVRGHARAVLHDLRSGSPSEGTTETIDLAPDADDGRRGLYIPPGVAHGFAALTDIDLVYLVDRTYDPSDELGLRWDDPAVATDWGLADPELSERDRNNPRLEAIEAGLRPRWRSAP
jgi:dTDP-4-dehydrorhamnose 3,5-epimerase